MLSTHLAGTPSSFPSAPERQVAAGIGDLSGPSFDIWGLLLPMTVPLQILWAELTGSELDKLATTIRDRVVHTYYDWGCQLPLVSCLDVNIVRNVLVAYDNMALSQVIPEFYPGLRMVIAPKVAEATGVDRITVWRVLHELYTATLDGTVTTIKFLRPATYAVSKDVLEHLKPPLDEAECGLLCEVGGWLKWGAIIAVVGVGAWAFFQVTKFGSQVRGVVAG